MKRILVSAYAVSPIRGSENAVGWEITTRLGQYFDITVLMCELSPSNIPYFNEISDYLKANGNIKNVHFIPVKMPMRSKKYTKLHDSGFWPAYYWGYKCWQKEAYRIAKDLNNKKRFEMAYHLNMIGFREPGYLWKLDIPFIWGPTNGFHSIPFSFLRGFKVKDLILQVIKHIANEVQIKLSLRAKKAAKKAKLVYCVDKKAMEIMNKWGANTELLSETGLSILHNGIQDRSFDGKRCLNLVWSGMITPGKALHILIEALIRIKEINFHLTIVGNGPLMEQMKILAKPVSEKITWIGWVEKEQAVNIVKEADLLIHTSLKEGTPHSILEALSTGIPVICHDTCGMGLVVNNSNGFKIPYLNYKTSINYLATLLNKIVSDPEILNVRFQTLWETIEELTWENKVKKIAKGIESILVTAPHIK